MLLRLLAAPLSILLLLLLAVPALGEGAVGPAAPKKKKAKAGLADGLIVTLAPNRYPVTTLEIKKSGKRSKPFTLTTWFVTPARPVIKLDKVKGPDKSGRIDAYFLHGKRKEKRIDHTGPRKYELTAKLGKLKPGNYVYTIWLKLDGKNSQRLAVFLLEAGQVEGGKPEAAWAKELTEVPEFAAKVSVLKRKPDAKAGEFKSEYTLAMPQKGWKLAFDEVKGPDKRGVIVARLTGTPPGGKPKAEPTEVSAKISLLKVKPGAYLLEVWYRTDPTGEWTRRAAYKVTATKLGG